MKNIALIIAGGSGSRMGQDIPKQFLNVYDKPVLVYTLESFQNHPQIDEIEVVCIDGWHDILRAYARQFNISKLKWIVSGGKTGQESIRNGVFNLEGKISENDNVIIHDGIRPLVSAEIISDCIVKTNELGNATACIPCAEAMIETEDGKSSEGSYPRQKLKRTQTPQGFKLGELLSLHKEAEEKGIENSVASCTLMIELGRKVYFSLGSEKNIKLTTVEDIDIFKALLTSRRSEWLK
jgi:2-C-methyl-D-erythritol 4-phosphate cytidylyltransferase